MEAAGWVLSAGATAPLSGAGRRCAPVPVPPGDAAELPSSRLCFLQHLELLPTRAGITAGQRGLEGRWQPTAHVKTRFLTPVRCSFVGPCSNALCIRHLGLVLFNAFAKDLDDGTDLEGVGAAPGGCAAIQREVDWPGNWANRNVLHFSRRKCKGLHWGRNSPIQQHRLGLSSCRVEKCRHTGESPQRATGVIGWQGQAEKGGAAPSEEQRA